MPKVTQLMGGSRGLNSKVCAFPFHAYPLVNGMCLFPNYSAMSVALKETGREGRHLRNHSLCSGCLAHKDILSEMGFPKRAVSDVLRTALQLSELHRYKYIPATNPKLSDPRKE